MSTPYTAAQPSILLGPFIPWFPSNFEVSLISTPGGTPCQQNISQICLSSSTSVLVTFFALAVLQRQYSPPSSSFLSGLQTGLGGAWALLPDELGYVNADRLGDPSGLFSCLSLGPQLPGGPKNCSAP